MMIADIASTPDPKFFWEFLLSIGFLISIAANIATSISVRRTQRREVNFGFVPASKEDFEKHTAHNQREHENLFAKINGVERGARDRFDAVNTDWQKRIDDKFSALQMSDQAGRKEIHERINQVFVVVSRLEGKMERSRHL